MSELYHLIRDPGESEDLADKNPDIRTKLEQKLEAWKKKTSAQLPVRKEQPEQN